MSQSELLCHLHRQLADAELDELRRQARALAERLSDDEKRLDARLLEISAAPPFDDPQESLAHAVDEYRRSIEYFPNQQRLGLLTLAYAVFENRINTIASAFLTLTRSQLVPSDFAGDSPLTRARRCITKAAKLDLPADAWNTLEPFRALRGVVVHSASHFTKGPPKVVKQFISDSDAVQVVDAEGIVVTDALVQEFVDRLDSFYRQLFTAWSRWS